MAYGLSITTQTAPQVLLERGYAVMLDEYEPDQLVYPSMVNIINDPSVPTDYPYGHRATGLAIDATPRRRSPGEPPELANAQESYAWQMAIHSESRSFAVTDEDIEAGRSKQILQGFTEFIQTFTRHAVVWKEEFIAGMYQKGTLTAGDLEYFNNRYKGTPDANAGFVYDGLPWFDTAHTLTASSATLSNHEATRPLSAANVGATYTDMSTSLAVDEAGKRIMNRPTHVVVPAGLRDELFQILRSERLPGSANNDRNPVSNLNLDAIVNPYLEDTASAAAWWMINASRGAGVDCFDSGSPELRTVRDELAKTTVIVAEFRFGAAVKNIRHAFSCNKSA